MSRKKTATHCSRCARKFDCREEFVEQNDWSLCWNCHGAIREQQVDMVYNETSIIKHEFAVITLTRFLYNDRVTSSGDKLITWARKKYPEYMAELERAHTQRNSKAMDLIGQAVVDFSKKIADEMNKEKGVSYGEIHD